MDSTINELKCITSLVKNPETILIVNSTYFYEERWIKSENRELWLRMSSGSVVTVILFECHGYTDTNAESTESLTSDYSNE